MSRLPRALPLLALLLAAACTPLQWVRENTGPGELEQDLAQCQQQAWREAALHGWYYRPLTPLIVEDIHGRRFFTWAQSPFGDPFGDRFFEESRLTSFCMRAKGYDLLPAEPRK